MSHICYFGACVVGWLSLVLRAHALKLGAPRDVVGLATGAAVFAFVSLVCAGVLIAGGFP